jgi:hypothetical protein
VYNVSIGAGNILKLNTSDASAAASTIWNSTAPTSTVFSLGNGWAGSYSTVAYCFAPVAGYSAFGSYTGNGSADGPFVYTNFQPKFILIKRTDAIGDWQLRDTSRDPINGPNGNALIANLSSAESATLAIDYLSNGFKLRDTGGFNTSGATYIYACFASNPFKFSNAR